MTGNFIKEKIERSGLPLAEVARNMGITPQALNERLNVKDIKTGVLEDIARGMQKSVYFFYDDTDISVKGNMNREPAKRYSSQKQVKNIDSSESDDNVQALLNAKDETIAALRKTIQLYEQLLMSSAK